jgi:hypothetical protein
MLETNSSEKEGIQLLIDLGHLPLKVDQLEANGADSCGDERWILNV